MNNYTIFDNSNCSAQFGGYEYKKFNDLYNLIENGTAIIKKDSLSYELERLYKKAKLDFIFMKSKDFNEFKKEYKKYIGA